MSKILSCLLLWSLFPVLLWGQSAQCPDVEIAGAPQITFPCSNGTECTTLTATFPDIRQTIDAPNAYQVSTIPYAGHELFQVPGATPILVNQDDVYSGVINLPFTFCFYGGQFNQVVVGANGTISFDVSYAGNSSGYEMCPGFFNPVPVTIPSTNNPYPRNAIFACFHDIDPTVNGPSNKGIEFALIGTAPCRKLVVNWRNIPQFSCTSTTSTFQCVLYENTNVIEMYVEKKPVCSNWNCGVAVIGVQNQARNQAVAAPGRNAAVWTTTTANSEAWRFIPNGPSLLNSVQLLDSTRTVIGTGTSTASGPGVLSASFNNICVSGLSAEYYIRANYTACSGSALSNIDSVLLVRVLPPAAPAVSSPVIYCQNAVASPLTATGSGLLWYTAPTGGTGTATAPTPSTATPGTTTWYVSQTVNGCEGPRAPVTVTVKPVVNAAVSRQICPGSSFIFAGQTINSAGTYTGTFTGANGCDSVVALTVTMGTAIEVNLNQTVCQGGSVSFNGNNYSTTGNYSFTTTSSGGCDSITTLHLTVNPIPAAPGVTSPVTYCQNAAATALTATGSNLLWYSTATGGTGTSAAPVPATTTPGTTTWFVSQTVNGCESQRTALNVIVNARPAAPSVTSPVTYCQNAAAAALTATGSGLLWYTAATGGTGTATAPTPSTATPGTTIWYVSQTGNGCEGPRAALSVVINATPAAPVVSSPIVYCQNSTATPLTANGSSLLWYTTATGGAGTATAPTPSTATPGTTTWYVSQTVNGCEGPRALLDVVVNANPPAPAVSSPVVYCQDAAATPLTATGNNLLWYLTATGGTGSSIAPLPLTSTPGTVIWYVSQTVNGCEGPRASISVVVNPTQHDTVTAQICPGGSYPFGSQVITSAGTYTETFPAADGCDSVVTLTMTVGNTVQVNITQTICQGESATFNGTTYTTAGSYSYTTPSSGGCDSTTTLHLTVNPPVTPTFAAVAPICNGDAAPVLPAISTNSISGTWNPATVSNTATGTYTFTPGPGQCASPATLTVTVNQPVTPTFTAIAPICSGATAPVLPATSNNGITGAWNPATVSNTATGTYTFTPNAGQCATTTTVTVTVNPNVTPAFTAIAPICEGATAPALPGTSNNGITGTWNPSTVSNTATGIYTFTPDAGQCATTATLTVTVNPEVTATQAITVCAAQLPYPWNGQSLTAAGTYTHTQANVNGCDSTTTLTFTVNPTINTTQAVAVCETQLPYPWNGQSLTASGTYTHTQPNAVGCDSTMTLTFTVNSQVTPAFAAIAPICNGATAPVLPTTSNNGITGTWNPAAVSNTATGIYTFTPNAGQCATTTTLTVTVNPNVTPAFTAIAPICAGSAAPVLHATSNNGITGTWNPATVSNTATGTYTFTPGAGQCATTATITVTVNPTVTATQAITVCAAQLPYPWNGQSLTAAGTYTHTQANTNGCDSTTTLTFTVNPTINTTQTVTVCETQLPYPWNGQSLTASGTYTHTQPNAVGCDSTMTLTFTVNSQVTPAFTAIAPICSGATAPVLPATSNNGITGAWNPATVSNTATGTYTFTPNAGQCATTTTLMVTVSPNVIPTFTAIAPICQGAAAPVLPATSNNGITGTWNPATVSNTATGTYTFTPNAGQCATTATITLTVNPAVTATEAITVCAAQLPYPWNGQSLTAAGTYTHTQANVNGCDSTTTLTFTVNPTINTTQAVTVCETQLPYPWNGQSLTASGTYTHTQPNAVGCDSTMTLTFMVNNQVTPAFAAIAPICNGATAPVLPATSNNGITGTWNPATVSNTATGTYTFTPNAGQCATTATLTVTVNPNVTPTFTAIAPICAGSAAPVLPATSNNGITGTWNPATVSNTATGTYTFTPGAGQCATTATLTVTVNPQSIPTFAAIAPICSGSAAPVLPATSTNGITGSWSPGTVSNTATGTYTFTPAAGQCAATVTLTVTVNPQSIPAFAAIAPICSGSAAPALPATSTNGITGSWSPGTVSNTATGTYTFTPNAGQCATTATLTVTVNPNVAPAFTAIAPICSGATAPVLPATSNNGIAGTWSPATVSNTATGTYTFSPNAGQCATTATLTVTVNPLPAAPVVTTPVSYCQDAPATPLSATGNNLLWYTTATGGTGIATAPTPATTTAGITTWYVSQSANGCEGPRAAIVVTVRPTPAAPSVSSPVAYCLGETATSLSAAGSSLLWYTTATGGNGTATAPTPQTTAPGATTWYVSQTIEGCEGPRAALTVTVHPLPPAPEVSSPVNYCQGDAPTPLTAGGNGLLWYTEASGGTASSTAPVPSSDAPGTQSWYVSQTENGCEGPRTRMEVIVHPNPTLDAKLDIVGTTMYLDAQATGAGLSYAWTPPDGLSCTDCDRPRADPERNTVYTVTVTTAAGCSASDTVSVYLDCNKVFIPNTFSPNGDGNNDRFYPIGLSLMQIKVFRVYNRWGELLFSRDNVPANDPLYGWDGNYQSKTVKPDVFVYYLEAICTTGEVISRKGDVTIIR